MFDNIRIMNLLAVIVCAIGGINHAINGDMPRMFIGFALAMANAFLIRRE